MVMFFLNVSIFFAAFFLGCLYKNRQIINKMIANPDAFIVMMHDLKKMLEVEEDIANTEVHIEQVGQHFYIYNKTTNQFLGQGRSIDEAMTVVIDRFPNMNFWGKGLEK